MLRNLIILRMKLMCGNFFRRFLLIIIQFKFQFYCLREKKCPNSQNFRLDDQFRLAQSATVAPYHLLTRLLAYFECAEGGSLALPNCDSVWNSETWMITFGSLWIHFADVALQFFRTDCVARIKFWFGQKRAHFLTKLYDPCEAEWLPEFSKFCQTTRPL